MENNNDWFDNLNYPLIDQQQQTFVTKHDLELLHKKIIATDLIVQKYQEANKALLRLQVENDDLKQQIEQITNECCIFSKQVTECTQECDNLKEQIEISNSEKRDLHQQIRLLQDENTNNYHEIMVLKQYESLKETNDQLTKTVERQQKTIGKLQLQLQRKTPIVYKPNKNKAEPTETDIALIKSQKSVRELKLALGRLVNFIQLSTLHIRPVLKAHEINDDFLEIEGDFISNPVKTVTQPVVSQSVEHDDNDDDDDDDNDDDDDDDNGDFIDVNHTIEHPAVNTTIPPVDTVEETPVPSKSTSRQQQKKKEKPKAKTSKKSSKKTRRQKDTSISETPSGQLDDLANKLELALSQPISRLSSCLSDDDNEDKINKSDKQQQQQLPTPIYTPIILQTITDQPKINSTISFYSDDEILTPSSSIIEQQQPVLFNEQINSSLQVDSITPMEIETSDKRTKYMSYLSEDDDETNKLETSIFSQEYISPLELNKSFSNNIHSKSQMSDKSSSLSSTIHILQRTLSSLEDLPSNNQIETISDNVQDSLLNKEDQSRNPSNILDSNRTQIVLRLLHVLTQAPVPLKPLRLVRHRIQQKKILEEQTTVSTDTTDTIVTDISVHTTSEQTKFSEDINPIVNETPETYVSLQMEEQSMSIDEVNTAVNNTSQIQDWLPIEDQLKCTAEMNPLINDTPETQNSLEIENQPKFIKVNSSITHTSETQDSLPIENQLESTTEINSPIHDISETEHSLEIENQPKFAEEVHSPIVETSETQVSLQMKEQPNSIEEPDTTINDIPEIRDSLQIEDQSKSIEEIHVTINEKPKTQVSTSTKKQSKSNEKTREITISKAHEERQNLAENNSSNKNLTVMNESSTILRPQELVSIVKTVQSEQSSLFSKNQSKQPLPFLVSKIPQQSLLKPFQTSIIFRLLNTLTKLPVKPLILPIPFSSKNRKRKSVIKKSSIPLLRQPSNRISRSPTRMQTRSLNSIRARIARCNQPSVSTTKRTITELISSIPISKRIKSMKIEENINEYDLINQFLNSFSKEINDQLEKILEKNLHDDISLFNDNIYRILSEFMINKCDIILLLVQQIHPYEESIKILLEYIHKKSSKFQEYFIKKLNQTFEYEIKQQQQISDNRIKILNRLFIHSCSIFASSSVIIYARLFDIGYYFSHDILIHILSFISNTYSSLISINFQTNSSNILLHQILFDILQIKPINLSNEYIENLLITYDKYTYDQEDLIRCFILISRYQSWLWCSKELCLKIFFPLLNKMIINQYKQRQIILILLQFILFIYKNNEDFQRDIHFHEQIKQLLLSLKTMNNEECIIRDKIFFILHSVVK